jgi:hypothetical protein
MIGLKDFPEEKDHTIIMAAPGLVNFNDFDQYNDKKPYEESNVFLKYNDIEDDEETSEKCSI